VNALARPEVGKYINAQFVSTYQKVATFRIVGNQKQGGNVAGYFCTPEGRVLHAIAGPVNGDVLLREARWVVEAHKLGQLEARDDPEKMQSFFQTTHSDRLRQEYGLDLDNDAGRSRRGLGNAGKVHLLLAAAPMPRLESVYKLVFEKILNERITAAPVVKNGG
jgi:hypothetical protein